MQEIDDVVKRFVDLLDELLEHLIHTRYQVYAVVLIQEASEMPFLYIY